MAYEAPRQGSLFDAAPDIDMVALVKRVRVRLNGWLETARAADTLPWSVYDTESKEMVMQQSSRWLPPEEREALRAAFKQELERLRTAG